MSNARDPLDEVKKTFDLLNVWFQYGFCTSGQIMSADAMIDDAKAGWPSAATTDVSQSFSMAGLSDT